MSQLPIMLGKRLGERFGERFGERLAERFGDRSDVRLRETDLEIVV
jgi:hypothetical protein